METELRNSNWLAIDTEKEQPERKGKNWVLQKINMIKIVTGCREVN